MKKASTNTMLETIIDILLVAGAILVLTVLFIGLVRIFGSGTEKNAASIHNLDQLVKQIDAMDPGDHTEWPIFIDESLFIIAFNAEQAQVNTGGCLPWENIDKGAYCGNRPCICLCEKNKDVLCKTDECRIVDTAFSFTSNSCNSAAVVAGQKEPRSIWLRRTDDTIKICLSEC